MNKQKTLLCLFVVLFFLSGCAPTGLRGMDAEPTLTPTGTPLTAAWTNTPDEPTVAKTLTPTLPAITMTPTVSPTPTLDIPVLSTAERAERIQQLFLQNDDCKFPCWLGVVPGVTGTHAALQHISSFIGEPPDVYSSTTKDNNFSYILLDDIDLKIIGIALFEKDLKISRMRVNIDKPWRIEGYSDFLSWTFLKYSDIMALHLLSCFIITPRLNQTTEDFIFYGYYTNSMDLWLNTWL
jgi:hypothetical protein